jgi:hypothetical protein
MSWTVNTIGTPAKVVEELDAHSARLSGPSKDEMDAALPHIKGIIENNFGAYHESEAVIIRLNAYGSAQPGPDGAPGISRCSVSVEVLTARI